MHNLCFLANFDLGILDFLQVYRVFVSQVVEEVKVFLCDFAFLLIAEDEVNPFIQVLADLTSLELQSMPGDEIVGIAAPPG